MLFKRCCQRQSGITLNERFLTTDFFLRLRFAAFFHEDWHDDGSHFSNKCENVFQSENKTIGNNLILENLHRENTPREMQYRI